MSDTALAERVDQLTRTCVELAAEVWTLRDRLTIVEHLLDTHGVVRRADVDAFQPDGALAEELAGQRQALAARVLGNEVTPRGQAEPAVTPAAVSTAAATT